MHIMKKINLKGGIKYGFGMENSLGNLLLVITSGEIYRADSPINLDD